MNKLFENSGFRFHALAYVVTNVILAIVNLRHPEHIWFVWPLLGWGAGLAAHGYAVWKGPKPLRRPPPGSVERRR